MRERTAPGGNDAGNDALRITAQFRIRNGMAYELRQSGARLTLLITEQPTHEARSEWIVEASSAQAPGAAVAQAGSTRAEALRRTGELWAADARGLPRFDWDAVTQALAMVRAI